MSRLAPSQVQPQPSKFLLEPPKRVHGLDPKWHYQPPPMDGSLTVSEIYDFHYKHNPGHPVFKYANGAGDLTTLAYSKVVPAAHNAARYIANIASISLDGNATGKQVDHPLIAIVATTDTITYFTTLLGMLRAEIPVFPISPRNSAPAVAHLLERTRPTHVLVSVETPIRDLVDEAIEQLRSKSNGQRIPEVNFMPTFEQIYTDEPLVPLPPRGHDGDATRIVVHSSGSSSFPKPIIWNDRTYLQVAMVPQFGAQDLCGQVIACHAVAMFHAIGLNLIAWLSGSGFVIGTFAPATPATVPTPDSVYKGIVDISPSFAFGVPVFIEAWSHDPAKVEYLKTIKGVIYGGGPLNKSVGDFLTSKGVTIYTFYGMTEIGVIGAVLPENPGKDWEYITLNPHCAAEFVPYGDGTYELVAVRKPTHDMTIINTHFRGQDAYATSDLLIPHPTKPGLWKIHGRADDQIMLSTGEKTNPGPLESILCQHPLVAHAMFFGRGRFQNGVLVQPVAGSLFDPTDEHELIEFRNAIWQKIEEMNAVAPTHSRIFKEMIITTDPSRPFIFTPKGSPKRNAIVAMYEKEIEAVYDAVEQSASNVQVDTPTDWEDIDQVTNFVRKVVNGILKKPAGDEDDLFEHGCDSLQATWIRNTLLGALRRLNPPITSVPPNLVYDYARITALAQYLHGLVIGSSAASSNETTLQDVQNCLARYTKDFPTRHIPDWITIEKDDNEGDVVFVTGTTGSLGSAVLAKLVEDPGVRKIYAFNRRMKGIPNGISPETTLLERQKSALRSRGFDDNTATSHKVVLVEGDLNGKGLGIADADLEFEITQSITHIIHIAWKVDFNMSFSSYEAAIGGVRTLVDLALSVPISRPPAKVTFISSVAVFRNLPHGLRQQAFPEEPLPDASISLGQGYAESKWAAEQILYTASSQCKEFCPVIVRVGQISGGPNGNWNTNDWVPVIVKSSISMGFLPEFKGICSWIPLELAARAIVDMRKAKPAKMVTHLVHPHPASAKKIFHYIGSHLRPSLPLLPYIEWVKKLEEIANTSSTANGQISAEDRKKQKDLLDRVPALKLLEFFRGGVKVEDEIVDGSGEAMGIPKLDISEAKRASSALREDAVEVGEQDAKLWIEYWQQVGYL